MADVERIAAALTVALEKIGVTIARLLTADRALEEATQALAQVTQGTTAQEIVQAHDHASTARRGITLLPAVLPPGATLTVYGTTQDGTPTVSSCTGGPP